MRYNNSQVFNSKVNNSLSSFVDNFLNNNLSDFIGIDTTKGMPAVNIIETDNVFQLEVAAAGLKKENFSIKIDNDLLKVSATQSDNKEAEEVNYKRREFRSLSFKRNFHIPNTVNTNEINASYNNGILQIELAKHTNAKVIKERDIEVL